ncbi:SAG family member, partial [Eimeria maxima]
AVDCSEQMNKEREPMGFPKFTVLDTKTGAEAENTVNTSKLCETIKANGDPGVLIGDTDISIAAAIQSSTEGDCAAATKQWKGVLKAMGDSLPPAYTPGEGIYNNLGVVSLMSLYTPKEGVAVTCTVIQCPAESSSAGDNQNSENNNGQSSNKDQQNPTSPPVSGSGTESTTGGTANGGGGAQSGTAGGSGSGSQGNAGTGQGQESHQQQAETLSKKKEDEHSIQIESGLPEGEV